MARLPDHDDGGYLGFGGNRFRPDGFEPFEGLHVIRYGDLLGGPLVLIGALALAVAFRWFAS